MKTTIKLFIISTIGVLFFFSCQERRDSNPTIEDNTVSALKITPDHFDTIIATVVSGEFVFVNNIANKISDWEDVVNNDQSLNVSFDSYDIEVQDNEYFLVGVDDSEKATSSIHLVLDSGNFYEMKYPGPNLGTPTGTTCTCSGCCSTGANSDGECEPVKNDGGQWYCTVCSKCTCVKSTSTTENGILGQ